MAEKTIKTRIQCKIDTAENWKTNNPVLLVGELGVESDTKLIKVGDGTTSWTSLPYLQYLPLSGGQLTGALKIARGFQKGLLDTDDTDILYIDNNGNLCIGYGLSGKTKLTSNRIDVESNDFYVKHNFYVENGSANFRYNGKSVAVTDDIPTALSQLSEDTTHRVVTDTEKSTWNAKSNFDGNYNSLTNKPTIPTNADFTLAGLKEKSYNSLTDKPTIPTKTSQLTNDSNFATTSNLSNYLPLSGGSLTGLVKTTSSFNILNSAGTTRLGSIGAFSNNYVGIDATNSIVLGKNGYNKKWFVIIDDDGSLIFMY